MKKKAVLICSEFFPAKHKRAGEKTYFFEKIEKKEKIHTIRGNIEWWMYKATSIANGSMYLSVRKWSGKPYYSEQAECLRLEYIRLQKINIIRKTDDKLPRVWIGNKEYPIDVVAKNDGLSTEDFIDWFFGNSKNDVFTGCVIHFTDFLY